MGLASRLVAVAGLVGGALVAPLTVASSADAVVSGEVDYVVATTADHAPDETPTVCTLREAVRAAGLDSSVQTACGEGAWKDGTARTAHITFAGAGRGVVGLDEQLVFPQRAGTEIWLDGAGAPGDEPVVVSGQDKTRIMWADSWPEETVGSLNGSLVLRDITLADARTPSGNEPGGGGAIRSGKQMDLDIDRVTFARNEGTAGSALYVLGVAAIRNSTFAHNHSRTEEFRTGAVTIVNETTTVHGSTFLHNTVESTGTSYGRDLVVVTGAVANAARLELAYNVFISPANDAVPSCQFEGIDSRVVSGGHNLHSTGSVLGRCYTAMGTGGAREVPLKTVPDSGGETLTDHGGWVDTVLLTADSENHDIKEDPLAPWCSKYVANPTRPDLDLGGTDARGVVRPKPTCDAGAIQREAQTIGFPTRAEGSTYVGADFPEPTATSGGPLGLTAGPAEVCDVDSGQVRLLALGSCTVTATQPGTDLFRAATSVQDTFSVVKTPRAVTIDNEPSTARVGSQWTVAATSSDGSTPLYSTATPDVCSVDGAVVTFAAVGTCTVRAELEETATAQGASDETSTEVQALTLTPQTITWNPAAPTGRVGQRITVTAIGGGSGNRVTVTGPRRPRFGEPVCSVRWQSRAGATTSVRLDLNRVGSCVLTATQPGNTDYSRATSMVAFDVLRRIRR